MDRMLNLSYAIEVINGRLNGSSSEVENNKDGFNNTTFTKKIGNRAMVSAVCQKHNMKDYLANVLCEEKTDKTKVGKQVLLTPEPHRYLLDDIFGFMLATKIVLEEEDYEKLDEQQKSLYKKEKKQYTYNATKKRVSRLQMSPLVNVSNRKVNTDFNVCATNGDSMPYKLESYSGIMSGIANFNISKVGEFTVSNASSEFRDYTEQEAVALGVNNLSKDEKFDRIEKTLKALEYLSIKGNQTNHLTDTKPKFVILGDYGWGNNVFQGVVNKDGLNVDMLKESLEQNEEYRLSKIYIGVNNFFDLDFKVNIEMLKGEFEGYDFIEIDNVHNTFNNYLKDLKINL